VELSLFVVHVIYFGTKHIHNVQHGHNLQNNWLIKESIIDCLISCHSLVSHNIMMQIYFLTYLLFYIKLVQIVVKTFSLFWTTCEKQTQFLYWRGS
jgi:hypothetical protein